MHDLVKCYKSLVTVVMRHLEFSIPVWSPFLLKDIALIENIQRRATKLSVGLQDTTILIILKLPIYYFFSFGYERTTRGHLAQASVNLVQTNWP